MTQPARGPTNVMHILLVEDGARTTSGAVVGAMRQQRITVDRAANAKTAFAMARTTNYDAVLVDQDLPDERGERVCQHLRRHGCRSTLLLKGSEPAPELETLIGFGASGYVCKPIDLTQLLVQIERARTSMT